MPNPIDGRNKDILVVGDLASGCQLAAHPAPANAQETQTVFKTPFEQHGPPLVRKTDNGSAFTATETRQLLFDFGVIPLLSPPRCPRYNGAAEAGIRSLKTRTRHHAACRGQMELWSSNDLQSARIRANTTARPRGPKGPTPQEIFECRIHVTPEARSSFTQKVTSHLSRLADRHNVTPKNARLDGPTRRNIARSAVEQALVDSGQLALTRRPIPQPLLAFFQTEDLA